MHARVHTLILLCLLVRDERDKTKRVFKRRESFRIAPEKIVRLDREVLRRASPVVLREIFEGNYEDEESRKETSSRRLMHSIQESKCDPIEAPVNF
jgi:hypothetical protein